MSPAEPPSDEGTTDQPADDVPTDPETIRAAFEFVPTIENPSEEDRQRQRFRNPPTAVPDEGPIPDWDATHSVGYSVTVPPWVLASVAYRLARNDDPDRSAAHDEILDYLAYDFEYKTPTGKDALQAVVDAAETIEDPDQR